MPGSIRSVRTLDVTSLRYDPEDFDSFPNRTKNITPLNYKRRSTASLARFPPSPEDSEDSGNMNSQEAYSAEERRITRPIDRGAPGDRAIFANTKTPAQQELAKRKSQYYGEAFAYRESNNSARERVTRESMVIADIKTNVIIQDEYTFITDLSYALSTRYQRPESSILVTVSHSACLLFGGNFEPAYTMTITALRTQLQPVTNKRNAILIAKHMEEGLGVGPERGIIKFTPILEENFATNGQTVAGMIEDLDREASEENSYLKRTLSRGTTKSKRRQSMRSLKGKGGGLSTHNEAVPPTPPPPSSGRLTPPPIPRTPAELSKNDRRAEKAQRMGRRKSFIASIFGK